MRVSVELPEQKADPLLKQLLTQFEALQRKLLGMQESPKADHSAKMLQMLSKQQDALVKAMERMMGKAHKSNGTDDAILQAMRGLKKTLAGLPDDLKTALNGSYRHTQERLMKPQVTVKPDITVNLGGLNKRLNRMEDALVTAAKKSRNKTFGSNY